MKPRTFTVNDSRQAELLCAWIMRREFPLQAEFGPVRKPRSLPANNRLWKLHRMAAEVVGDSAEGLHEDMLCAHYGWREVKMQSGQMKRVPLQRSSDKDSPEFRAFMDFCEMTYAKELGLWLDEREAA